MKSGKTNLKKLQFNNLSSKSHTIIIVLYGILLTAALMGFGNIYGHATDWLSQHIVFPEIFRQNFYANKTLIPNFLFDVGGGQNIFNFTYYCFLSPGVLLSYLLPFVDMMVYIIIFSIVSYLSTGVLVYNFLRRHFGNNKAFACAIFALTLPPFTNHFHHHIMFVWYLPFFVLALIGLDRFFEKGKFLLFIISTFLMIMTNYYFSVSALVFLFVYAVYLLLKENEKIGKEFFKNAANVVFIFAVPILLCAFLLLPTAHQILGNSRIYESETKFVQLVIPRYKEYFYTYTGMGLCATLLFAAIGNLCRKNKSKADIFLNGFAIFTVVVTLFIYVLNGFLYARGKVASGFTILFLYCFCSFIQNLEKKTINLKLTTIIFACYLVFSVYSVRNLKIGATLALEIALLLLIVFWKKKSLIYVLVGSILLVCAFKENSNNEYVSIKYYEEMRYTEITDLAQKTPEGLYRTDAFYYSYENANKLFSDNYHNTSVYSSTSNRTYQNFYLQDIGNNQTSRNCFVVAGTNNELFHTFMGTKYIIAKQDPGFYYEEISKGETLNLYENRFAYPLAYKSKQTISKAQFEKLEFPYSAECLMHYTVVDDAPERELASVINECEVQDEYRFVNTEEENYKITLNEKYRNKIVYLSFDIFNEGEYYISEDLSITINNVQNKLTDPEWLYYNGNTNFQYVIPMENTTELNLIVSPGKFDIRNVKMFTSDMIYTEYESPENLVLDESAETLSGKVVASKGEYFVTSIPYDKGFTAYINGQEVDTLIVNEAFVGLKLVEGENNIVIKYRAPLFLEGVIVSLFGLILLIAAFFRKTIFNLIKKYRELVMYIIFGVATTVVSLVTFFLCSKFIFNTENPLQLQAANIVSWIVSVLFAYVTNKKFVFRSHASPLKEMFKFYLSRVGTLVVEMFLMYVLVTVCSVNDMLSKLVVQFIVIVLNYILGKIVVFREGKKC